MAFAFAGCVESIWAPHPFITISSAGNVNHSATASETTKRLLQVYEQSTSRLGALNVPDGLRVLIETACGARWTHGHGRTMPLAPHRSVRCKLFSPIVTVKVSSCSRASSLAGSSKLGSSSSLV